MACVPATDLQFPASKNRVKLLSLVRQKTSKKA
jgi:hypothetical protein